MIAKKEVRAERTDVFSIWEDKKEIQTINGIDTIVVVSHKIDEFTIVDKEKQIADSEKESLDKANKIKLEKDKLKLVKALK